MAEEASSRAERGSGRSRAGRIRAIRRPRTNQSTVSVWVQSGNADIYLFYWSPWNRSASDYSQEAPVMAMAGDVLVALRKSSG